MEVVLAEHAGFCFGVKRAVDTVLESLESGKKIYTYGPIVHNESVVNELSEKGVNVLENEEDLLKLIDCGTSEKEKCAVVIRAHGVPRRITELITESGMECIDATCPFVKRIHRIVEKAGTEDKHVIIIGDKKHPEVEGIVGWCLGKCTVFETPEEVLEFEPEIGEKLCIVSQTTYNFNKFQYIVDIFRKKGYNDSVVNTICNATEERQQAAQDLAKKADVMIVIGGRHSSNTKKLYDICKAECENTYFIQTLDDLHLDLPKANRLVGITAGASTPN
ncbi:MAG: 4-hydroxy-3-methylbut-2-enyl diphosphate reductase, partial [Lachnospiraceae bacterium]|nr:4-hydroxy-3-methylbut-2-enyl diphosphate reductase [Lachnospiraceae bacterium]